MSDPVKKVLKEVVWEDVADTATRLKVFGGWIVKCYEPKCLILEDRMQEDYEWTISTTFVPDPKHEWDIHGPI